MNVLSKLKIKRPGNTASLKCPKCGNTIIDKVSLCPVCRHPIELDIKVTSLKKKVRILIAVVFIIFAGLAFYFVVKSGYGFWKSLAVVMALYAIYLLRILVVSWHDLK